MRHDDDALSWDGDDPSHVNGVLPMQSASRASGADDESQAGEAPSGGSALLVGYGIIGGVYLLYVIGWVIGVQRDTFTTSNLLFEVMHQFGEFSAIVSPVLWFGLTFLLTRARHPVIRVLWLVVGSALLVPWPFILSGSVA